MRSPRPLTIASGAESRPSRGLLVKMRPAGRLPLVSLGHTRRPPGPRPMAPRARSAVWSRKWDPGVTDLVRATTCPHLHSGSARPALLGAEAARRFRENVACGQTPRGPLSVERSPFPRRCVPSPVKHHMGTSCLRRHSGRVAFLAVEDRAGAARLDEAGSSIRCAVPPRGCGREQWQVRAGSSVARGSDWARGTRLDPGAVASGARSVIRVDNFRPTI